MLTDLRKSGANKSKEGSRGNFANVGMKSILNASNGNDSVLSQYTAGGITKIVPTQF